jgi:arginase family enzyme
MAAWRPDVALDLGGAVYVSLDLDVLDPAFAPGVSHHEPGGLATREVVGLLQRLRGRVVGADLVELNPTRDPSGVTAMVAAKLVKELVARLLKTRWSASTAGPAAGAASRPPPRDRRR